MYSFLISLTVFHLFLNSTFFTLKMQINYEHISGVFIKVSCAGIIIDEHYLSTNS